MYCIIYYCYEKNNKKSDFIRYNIMMIIILYELTVGHFDFHKWKNNMDRSFISLTHSY